MASSESAIGTPGQSASAASVGGAASSLNESPSGSSAAVSGVLSADEELQRDWEAFGRQELYEVPTEQELRDLISSRHRSRGERERRKRLKRNRQLLERMRTAAVAGLQESQKAKARVSSEDSKARANALSGGSMACRLE